MSHGDTTLIEESVPVEGSVELNERVCKVIGDVADITSSMLEKCSNAATLVVSGGVSSTRKDALSEISSTFGAIVVVGEGSIKPESCDFGLDEVTRNYKHIPVFGENKKDPLLFLFRHGMGTSRAERFLFSGTLIQKENHSP